MPPPIPIPIPNRCTFTTLDTITHLWTTLSLPTRALSSLSLPDADTLGLPSSYKVGHLAQSSIALSALAAALVHSDRTQVEEQEEERRSTTTTTTTTTTASPPIPNTTVPLQRACIEFASERLYTLIPSNTSTNAPPSSLATSHQHHAIGGLHRTARGGHVRIHDGFPHHRANALRLLGCPTGEEGAGPTATAVATREGIDDALSKWDAVEFETQAIKSGAVVGALRSVGEWDLLEQAGALSDVPVLVRRVADGDDGRDEGGAGARARARATTTGWKSRLVGGNGQTRRKALEGVRILEFSRVIAAPVAGRTLAAHGADVLWVTSPNLPDLPALDRDFARGKRSVHLDLDNAEDVEVLDRLLGEEDGDGIDVVIQGYRPDALAKKGLSVENLVKKKKSKNGAGGGGGIIHASLSAYGSSGPWSQRRGFDSIVQTQSGLNVSEAEHFGEGEASKVLPCQVLDHASGYFLAFGIMAALYKQATEGGSYTVEVSLAATMKYLRSLGQYEGKSGFNCKNYLSQQDLPAGVLETRDSEFGRLTAVKHSASIEGLSVGWELMPQKPVGSKGARWL